MTQIQRSLATLGAIAVLGGGLAGYAVWSHKRDAKEKKAKNEAAQLFHFKPGAVDALTVTAKGQTTVLKKRGGTWRITSPVSALADRTQVHLLLTNLTSLHRKRIIVAHAKGMPAKYGFDKPVAKIRVTHGGKTDTLTLGMDNHFSSTQYAETSGSDAVMLLKGMHDFALARSTFALRDKRLLVFNKDDIQKIQVNAAPDAYTIVRKGKTWQVTTPTAERADPETVSRVLGVAMGLKAQSIVDEKGTDLAKYGLDKPLATVTLTKKDGAVLKLAFGQTTSKSGQKHLFAQSSAQSEVAKVTLNAPNALHQSMAALQDKTVAHVKRNQVAAMQFTTAKGLKILVKRNKPKPDGGTRLSWSELSPATGTAKIWKVNSLLYLFSDLRAVKVVAPKATDLSQYGLDKPEERALLQNAAGKTLAEVSFGKLDGKNRYAKAAGDPRIFEITKSRLNDLPTKAGDLLEPPALAKK